MNIIENWIQSKLARKKAPLTSETQNPLAEIERKIAEYEALFGEKGDAPWQLSFGTLTPEEQRHLIDRFASDEEPLPHKGNMTVYPTNLVDSDGNALYLKTVGDYGVQIDGKF